MGSKKIPTRKLVMINRRSAAEVRANTFFRKFQGSCHASCVEEGRELLLGNPIPLLFREHATQPWVYFLIVGTRKNATWSFKIESNWRCEGSHDPQRMQSVFHLDISPKVRLTLRFRGQLEMQEAALFRSILAKLIFQTRERHSYKDCGDRKEWEAIIPYESGPADPPNTVEKIEEVFSKLKARTELEFAVLGSLWKIVGPNDNGEESERLLSQAVLAVLNPKPFEYRLVILDENGTEKSNVVIGPQLDSYSDYSQGLFYWCDREAFAGFSLAMAMSIEELAALEYVWFQLTMETRREEPFQQIINNSEEDWRLMYGGGPMEIEESHILEAYQADLDGPLEFSLMDGDITVIDAPAEEGGRPLEHLLQSRQAGVTIASRGGTLDVYAFDPQTHTMNLRGKTKISNSEDVAPKKIELIERQGQVAFTDSKDPSSLFISDLERGEVIKKVGMGAYHHVEDFDLLGGKNSLEQGSGQLLAVTKFNIVKVDPRTPSGIASSKTYSSQVNFDKVIGVWGECYATSSDDGSIRTFNNVGDKARNVLPSQFYDRVLSLDSSKDRRLLLANCGRYLLLFNTQQGGTDVYSKMYRKVDKPVPLILKVHPTALSRLGIQNLSFKRAKFDERKNEKEKAIIASNDQVVAIWSLSQIAQHKLVTTEVRRLGDRVVQADFMYDGDEIITAHPNSLGLKRVGKKK